jgi:asparagine synthase (glutamine-hydrolysing)
VCGIAGIVASAGVDGAELERMSRAIEHRGPDGSGYLMHVPGEPVAVGSSASSSRGRALVGFAHRRLSIIDLSDASSQPMVDEAGRLALTYNGEIYNYVELRASLERLGHRFRTNGDTEVVLNAYKQWGPDCVRHFVGMWAYALLDLDEARLCLSRDRFGIKPLFYTVEGGTLRFASEIKALLAGRPVPAPNEDALRRFLLVGRGAETDESFFTGVMGLPPAHNAIIRLGAPSQVRLARYWSYPEEQPRPAPGEAEDAFASAFTDAIRLHARADVAVGTCLSGGLDSSAIVCVADRLRRVGQVPDYAHVGFGYVTRDAALSERPYMEAVARQTSLHMTYVEPQPDRVLDVIPLVVQQQDEPFGSASIVVQWFVFEAARRAGIKVMLDGQGADEVLGGYHAYLPMVARTMLRRWRFLRYRRFAAAHRGLLGVEPLGARDALGSVIPPLRALGSRHAGSRLTPAAAVISPGMRGRWREADADALRPRSTNEILQRASALQLPDLLRFEDRNSMAHSIEARVPFLDHRLVELAFALPGDEKIRGVETKRILRASLGPVLPEVVLNRTDKVGFRPDPGVTWKFAQRHRDWLLAAPTAEERRWFDQRALVRVFDGADRSSEAERVLWRVVNTKLWLRHHWSGETVPGSDPQSAAA